jgi:hypothetical protein
MLEHPAMRARQLDGLETSLPILLDADHRLQDYYHDCLWPSRILVVGKGRRIEWDLHRVWSKERHELDIAGLEAWLDR